MSCRSSPRAKRRASEIELAAETPAGTSKKRCTRVVPVERRLARYKPGCPASIRERMERVMTQRFFLVERRRDGEELREEFKVLGSTGNVYIVIIDSLPSCDCPDACKGNHCKHILFIFLKVLNVPLTSPYWYQKALLQDELSSIFAAAPTNPTVLANARVLEAFTKAEGKLAESSAKQKEHRIPGEDDDCPICYESMGIDADTPKLTFCDQCGNALHIECFQKWARTRKPLTCVWCRAEWVTKALRGQSSSRNEEGYINLGTVAGLSTIRDTTTYHDSVYRRGLRPYYRSHGYDEFYC